MGDTRYQRPYRAVHDARDRAAAIRALSDEEVVQALAAAGQERDALLANVLATEAMNRMRRSRAITAHLAEGAFALDNDTRLTFVNPAMASAIGSDWRDLVGSALADVVRLRVTSAPRATRGDPIGHALRHGGTHQFEGEIARLAGEPVPASFTVAPILRDGVVDGVVVAFRDAREERRARALLEESHERYRSLFELSPTGIVSIDLSGTITDVNPAGLRLTARTREDVVGRPFGAFVDERDHERMLGLFAQVVAGEAQRSEFGLIHSDGRILRCEATGIPILLQGEVVGVHGVFREIGGALRASEERYRVLVESVKDYAIFLLDPDGRVQTWNEGARRIKGYEPVEIIGSSIERFYTPEALAAGLPGRLLAIAAAEGRVEDIGWRVRRDGSRFWADVVITALRDEDGGLRGYAKVTRDITDRMRAEEAMRANEERYRALSRELEAFSYTVAHDLRAPIRAIYSLALFLEQDHAARLDAEGLDLLRSIAKSAESMSQLVEDLLAFSRSSKGDVDLETVDLSAIAREVAAELSAREPARTGTFDIADGIVVRADPRLLRIVLVNLLGNAWKFTRHRPRYEVRVTQERGAEQVTVHVADNGAGFPAEKAFELFQPFRRLHGANDFPGTGVGLATVRRIVERHGGSVRAEGRAGQGARFSFTLPAAR